MRALTLTFASALAALAVIIAPAASAETNYDAPVIVMPEMPDAPEVAMPDYPDLPTDTALLDQLVSNAEQAELAAPQSATKPRTAGDKGKDGKQRAATDKNGSDSATGGTSGLRPGQVRSPEELLAILQAANAETATPQEQAELVPPQSAAKAESGLPLGTLAAVGGSALLVWYAAAVLRRRREAIGAQRAQAG